MLASGNQNLAVFIFNIVTTVCGYYACRKILAEKNDMRLLTAVLALSMVIPKPAFAGKIPSFLIGTWAESERACKRVVDGFLDDYFWYNISDDVLGGLDFECDFQGFTKSGMTIKVQARCGGETDEEDVSDGMYETELEIQQISDNIVIIDGSKLVKCN